jgi:hypothetical protein
MWTLPYAENEVNDFSRRINIRLHCTRLQVAFELLARYDNQSLPRLTPNWNENHSASEAKTVRASDSREFCIGIAVNLIPGRLSSLRGAGLQILFGFGLWRSVHLPV